MSVCGGGGKLDSSLAEALKIIILLSAMFLDASDHINVSTYVVGIHPGLSTLPLGVLLGVRLLVRHSCRLGRVILPAAGHLPVTGAVQS